MRKRTRNKKINREEEKNRRYKILKTCLSTALASFVFSLVISLFYFGYHFMITTKLFSLESIEMNELHKTTRDEIIQQAGIAPSSNILSLNLKDIEKKILQNPWVLKVEIYRMLPQKLTIRIQEKTVLSLLKKGKDLFYIDSEGEIIKRASTKEGLNYPVITSLLSGEEETQYFEKALWLLQNTSQSKYLNISKISEILLQESKGLIVINLPHATRIKLGSDDFVKKLTRLEKVFDDLEKRNIIAAEIDLNFKKNVVVKLRKKT